MGGGGYPPHNDDTTAQTFVRFWILDEIYFLFFEKLKHLVVQRRGTLILLELVKWCTLILLELVKSEKLSFLELVKSQKLIFCVL